MILISNFKIRVSTLILACLASATYSCWADTPLTDLQGAWAIGSQANCKSAAYIWSVVGDHGMQFRSAGGHIDVEQIVDQSPTGLTSITTASAQVATGTRWLYHVISRNKVMVTNVGSGAKFNLLRCPSVPYGSQVPPSAAVQESSLGENNRPAAETAYRGSDSQGAQPSGFRTVGLTRAVTFDDNVKCFKDNSGCTFHFISGRRFLVAAYYLQVQDVFNTADETGDRQYLEYDWSDIWSKPTERAGSTIVMGQYNFTGNKPDALVVASARQNTGSIGTLCGVNVYMLVAGQWKLAGILKATDVLGACEIDFKVNKITIQRNLRGFYYQLTFQNGRFEDTSNL